MFGLKKHYTAPPIEWATERYLENARLTEYTPDYWKLQQAPNHLFFFYDNMMDTHPSHNLISNSFQLCTAFTYDKFELWKKKLGKESFPIPLESSHWNTHKGKIKGELYSVPTPTIPSLDKYRFNGVEFERRFVRILIPYCRRVTTSKLANKALNKTVIYNTYEPERMYVQRAWMYVGVSDYWEPLLDGGYYFGHVGTFDIFRPELGRYYAFTHEEYNN